MCYQKCKVSTLLIWCTQSFFSNFFLNALFQVDSTQKCMYACVRFYADVWDDYRIPRIAGESPFTVLALQTGWQYTWNEKKSFSVPRKKIKIKWRIICLSSKFFFQILVWMTFAIRNGRRNLFFILPKILLLKILTASFTNFL